MGDLHLNLWDCGGQDSYMDTYLSTQRSTIFQQVGVMIYVFDVESRENHKDLEYFKDCMTGLKQFSPDAAIFLLLHKMDLVRERAQVFDKRKAELEEAADGAKVSVFGTSIYDESLYKVRVTCEWLVRKSLFLFRLGRISSTHLSQTPLSCPNTYLLLPRHATLLRLFCLNERLFLSLQPLRQTHHQADLLQSLMKHQIQLA